MNIYKIFEEATENFPDNVAIVEEKQKITYSELSQAVNNKAIELRKKGIVKGDRVLVFIPMSTALYVFLLATFKIGAVAVFVDEWANKKRLTDCLTKVPCKGFGGGFKAKILRFFYRPLRKIPLSLSSSYHFQSSNDSNATKVSEDDTALVTFTTGSTSIPKAANRTHGFLKAQFLTLAKELKTTASDIDFIGLPIVVLCNLGTGATSVLPNYNLKKPNQLKPEKVAKYISDQKVNRIAHSPSFFKEMGKSPIELPSIQQLFTGGAPVFPADIILIEQSFTHAETKVLYGSTEAEPISSINGKELKLEEKNIAEKGLCVGTVASEIQIKILHSNAPKIINAKELESLTVEKGEIGEIVVAGNHVLKSYLNSEEDTKRNKIKSADKTWHRTGDAGRIINNKLYLQGRINQLFEIDNKTISPFIYECLLGQMNGVAVGTIMVLEEVVAFIQPKEKVDEKVLGQAIRKEFPIIESVVFIDEMPLDERHNSKIEYEKLRELV